MSASTRASGMGSGDVDAVIDAVAERTAPGQVARLHVFLHGSVSPERTADVARTILRSTRTRAARSPAVVSVQKLGRSFLVAGDVEDLRAIAHHADVKAVLQSEIQDVYPKPLNRRRLQD